MNLNEVSTYALAYLGDSVIELCVRELLVKRGVSRSRRLNDEAGSFVRAGAQSEAVKRIIPMLTEQEYGIFHRGRNSVKGNIPKSATPSEYRDATGMEVLFGYLYLSGDMQRIDVLFRAAYGITEIE